MKNKITFSTGEIFEFEKIGLFDLDHLRPSLTPFRYKIEILGKEYEVEFDKEKWAELPKKPDLPEDEIKPGTPEYYELTNWKLWQAATAHEEENKSKIIKYVNDVAQYLLEKYPQVKRHIKEVSDWEKFYKAVLSTPVTFELLNETFEKVYGAKFEGIPVLEALESLKEENNGDEYDTIKLWENQLMIEMQMSESEYVLLSPEERARKICAMILPKIMETLTFHRQQEKMKNEKR